MESTPDTSAAKRSRAKPKVVTNPVETQSAAVKKPRAPRKSPTAQPATADASIVAATLESATEEVGGMIATAAYFLAASRNFSPGHELDDWLEAERLIHAKLYG
jgi:hypothetical protein